MRSARQRRLQRRSVGIENGEMDEEIFTVADRFH